MAKIAKYEEVGAKLTEDFSPIKSDGRIYTHMKTIVNTPYGKRFALTGGNIDTKTYQQFIHSPGIFTIAYIAKITMSGLLVESYGGNPFGGWRLTNSFTEIRLEVANGDRYNMDLYVAHINISDREFNSYVFVCDGSFLSMYVNGIKVANNLPYIVHPDISQNRTTKLGVGFPGVRGILSDFVITDTVWDEDEILKYSDIHLFNYEQHLVSHWKMDTTDNLKDYGAKTTPALYFNQGDFKIDLGDKLTSIEEADRVKYKLKFLMPKTSRYTHFLMGTDPSDGFGIAACIGDDSISFWADNIEYRTPNTLAYSKITEFEAIYENRELKLYIDNTLYQIINDASISMMSSILQIGRQTNTTVYGEFKLYEASVEVNNECITKLIPCNKGEVINNVTIPSTGLYDIKSNQLHISEVDEVYFTKGNELTGINTSDLELVNIGESNAIRLLGIGHFRSYISNLALQEFTTYITFSRTRENVVEYIYAQCFDGGSNDGVGGWAIRLLADNRLELIVGTDYQLTSVEGSTTIITTNDINLIITKKYNKVKVYLDGQLEIFLTLSSNYIKYNKYGVTSIGMGYHNGVAAYPLQGSVSDVRVYDKALTNMEVKYLTGTKSYETEYHSRYMDDRVFVIKHKAGNFDFSWDGPAGTFYWKFWDGSTSTDARPTRQVGYGTSYLISTQWDGMYAFNQNSSDDILLIDLADLPPFRHILSLYRQTNITGSSRDLPKLDYYLNIEYCTNLKIDLTHLSHITNTLDLLGIPAIGNLSSLSNITKKVNLNYCRTVEGDLSSLSNVTWYIGLRACSKITGDLSSLQNLTFCLNVSDCPLITGDLSDIGELTYCISVENCTNITGDLASVTKTNTYLRCTNCTNVHGVIGDGATPTDIRLHNTGLTKEDIEANLIKIAGYGKDNGMFWCATNMPTIDDPEALAAKADLESRGWDIQVNV